MYQGTLPESGEAAHACPKEASQKTTPKTVRPQVAIFSKSRCDIAPEKTSGLPMDFIELPDPFDKEFKRAATPSAGALLSCGLTTIDPGHLDQSGAWMVKLGKTHSYLCHQRHASPSANATYLPGRKPMAQSTYLEQTTFRYNLKDWSRAAPDLMASAEMWMMAQKDLRQSKVKLSGPPTELNSPVKTLCPRDHAGKGLRFGNGSPSIVLTSDLFAADNLTPMRQVLALMSPEQRAQTSVAYGYRNRINGISVQLFDANRLKVSNDAARENSWDIVLARQGLHSQQVHSGSMPLVDVLDLVVNSDVVTDEIRNHYPVIRPRLVALKGFASADLIGLTVRQVELATTLLEEAFVYMLAQKQEMASISNAYKVWIEGIFSTRAMAPISVLRHLSWLEIAPSMAAGLLFSPLPGLKVQMLAILFELKTKHRDIFERFEARMSVKNAAEPIIWQDVFSSSLAESLHRQHFQTS